MIDKPSLLKSISLSLNEKIIALNALIDDTRASNNDTKSSMGDKYETGREMLQQQINHLQNQLNVALSQQNTLSKINLTTKNNVSLGSFVVTENAQFFIATSIGEFKFEDQKIFVISDQSPIALAMMNKKINDVFDFNKKSQKIINLY